MNISVEELKRKLLKERLNLIDLRVPGKYQLGTIADAKNISTNELLYNIEKYLKKDTEYYLFCDSGAASYKLSKLLNNVGYKTYSIEGGYNKFIL